MGRLLTHNCKISSFRRKWGFLLASVALVSALAFHSLWLGTKMVGPLLVSEEEEDSSSPRDAVTPLSTSLSSSLSSLVPNNETITIMVDLRAGWRDWGFSFFESEQLQLYGRHNYKVEWFHFDKDPQRLERLAQNDVEDESSSKACLLVSNPVGLEKIRQTHAKHCKTWIINDEYCTYEGDFRHYFKQESKNDEVFVPLGPRYDFDRAYRDHYAGISTSELRRKNNLLPVVPTSQRKYIFNAIFSKSTSPSRKDLKSILLNSSKYSDNNSSTATTTNNNNNNNQGGNYFIQIPGKWRRQMHPVYHVNSNRYVEILSQSKFTLSPTGHNPECFRFYESIIMGSIPIVVVADEEYQTHKCPNALAPLLEWGLQFAGVSPAAARSEVLQDPVAHFHVLQEKLPFVVLNNWTQLDSTVEGILNEGPEALDARQTKLRHWYIQFMTERVWNVEDYLLIS